jgi:hypothetical protein
MAAGGAPCQCAIVGGIDRSAHAPLAGRALPAEVI